MGTLFIPFSFHLVAACYVDGKQRWFVLFISLDMHMYPSIYTHREGEGKNKIVNKAVSLYGMATSSARESTMNDILRGECVRKQGEGCIITIKHFKSLLTDQRRDIEAKSVFSDNIRGMHGYTKIHLAQLKLDFGLKPIICISKHCIRFIRDLASFLEDRHTSY